ncbi:hypothetical protein D9Q98_007897 [Chlorella vulgaris]|uniref:Hydrophobin n=1 Tax=Chlorella vulgaris TaxID=3077 RepID=A0A9D4YTS0_CHLVU|nr:hypothetical protein D9Q98_007897 [Chlorella vulgaris]
MARSLALLLVLVALSASVDTACAKPNDLTFVRNSRKMLQVPEAVCCLIDNRNGQAAQCEQQKPNQQKGNSRQNGLINVQGVFVNVGCVQVLASVDACVNVGSVIGTGYCLRGGNSVADSTGIDVPDVPGIVDLVGSGLTGALGR